MRQAIIDIVKKQAEKHSIDWRVAMAFVEVETGGMGFDPATGKLIIQFEPAWFKKKAPYAPSGKWSLNKVERQAKEWEAFNDAFAKNPDAAMKSTSIGIGQIMGLHYLRIGYPTVGAMWDDARRGEERQLSQMFAFIATDNRLLKAIREKDFNLVAVYYNGAGYRKLAAKYGREPYDISMAKAYERWSREP